MPPNSGSSARRSSVSGRVCSAPAPVRPAVAVEDRHDAGGAVHAQPLAGLDPRRRGAGADHGRQPVLARDDRGVGHDPADVRDRRGDLGEDRRPGRRGDRADEDLARAHRVEVAEPAHHARRPLDLPGRRRRAVQLAGPVVGPSPLLEALRGDPPEHHHDRVVHRLGHPAEGGRRRPLVEPLEQLLAPRHDRRPVVRAQRLAAGRPRERQLLERLHHLVAGELEDVLASPRKPCFASSAPNSRTLLKKRDWNQ